MNEEFADFYKDLFERTSDLIQFASLEGILIKVNPAWLAATGYTEEEVLGRPIFDFINPPCIEEYESLRNKVIHSTDPGEFRTSFVTKRGKIINLEGQVGASVEDGKVKYTRGVFRNITAKLYAEKRLKTFFDSAPDAIVVIDQNEIISEWNPKAEELFGFMAHEMMGAKLSDTIIPHQYRAAHRKGMKHFLITGEGPVLNKTIEITALHKDGHEFYINLSISNVSLDGGWFFIAFISDITNRKKTEEALIRKEAELLQARIMENKKDEFITIASHELKTPLTTIKAYTQIALASNTSNGPESVNKYLLKVDQHASKLNTLINDLLDVSRIQAGKLQLAELQVPLNEFLPDVLSTIQHITQSHTIEFAENAQGLVSIDPLRLEQVVTNIISNAVKYSPGRDKIIVRSVKKGDEMIISFQDFGIGIDEENINLIFTRFYRSEKVATEFSGLGIGLFIASEIVKQHNGSIWVESQEDSGSTFYLKLPIAQKITPPT